MKIKRAELVLRIEAAGLALLMLLQLAACNKAVAVEPALRQQIEQSVTREYGYRSPLQFGSIWRSSGEKDNFLTCGVFAAPPEFGGDPARLRFVYDVPRHHSQVEMHRFWVTGSAVSQAVIDMNRRAFDDLWTKWCAPFEPSQLSLWG